MSRFSISPKNTRKNVLFRGFGYALPLLAALVTIPIMVAKLGADLYGLYVICISLIGFMVLVDLGVGQTIIKYVAEYESTDKKAKVEPVLGVAFLVYLLIGIVSALALYVFAPLVAAVLYRDAATKHIEATLILQVTALPLLFSYVNQFFLNTCKAYHRFDLPAVIQNAGTLGGIIISSILLLLGFSLLDVMWGYVLIYGLALVAGYFSCLHVLPAGIGLKPVFERQVFNEIVSFSFYTFIGNLLSSLTLRADKLAIGAILGTEAVTYYQIPFTIAQMANGIIHTLVQIAFPRFSEMVAVGDKQGMLALYKKVGMVMSLISMVIAVLLISVGGDFLALWISPEFARQAVLTLQIIALYFFFHSNTVTGYWLLQGNGQAKLTAFIAVVGSVAYFVGMYYFGTNYGHSGVAMALFLLLLLVPLQYVWIARHIGHSVTAYVTQVAAFFAMGYVMLLFLAKLNGWLGNGWLEIMVNGVLGLAVLLAGVYWLLKRDGSQVSNVGANAFQPVSLR